MLSSCILIPRGLIVAYWNIEGLLRLSTYMKRESEYLLKVSRISIHRFYNIYSTVDLKYSNLETGTAPNLPLKGIIP